MTWRKTEIAPASPIIACAMNSTTLRIRNLILYGFHGARTEEATLGQRFSLDVIVELAPTIDLKKDDPTKTLDYVALHDCLCKTFESRRFNLIESCADALAEAIIERFDEARSATVTVKKPSVPVDCTCDWFAAEAHRCR